MITRLALRVGETALAAVLLIAAMEATSAFYVWRDVRRRA